MAASIRRNIILIKDKSNETTISVKAALRLDTTKEINGLWHAFIEIEKEAGQPVLPENWKIYRQASAGQVSCYLIQRKK